MNDSMISQLGDPSAQGTPEKIIAGLKRRDPVATSMANKLYAEEDSGEPTIGTYADDTDVPGMLWDAWRAAMRENGIPECGDDYEELTTWHQKAIARAVELFAGSVDWDQGR